jgi:hypothetical protein
MQNQPIQNTAATETSKEKLTWETPKIQEFSPRLIQQQEEEELMRLLSDENAFRLLSGSLPS